MDTETFLGVNQPGRGVDKPHPSKAEIEERVEQNLYSFSGFFHSLFWSEINCTCNTQLTFSYNVTIIIIIQD
jgi:hypothetical protein